MFDVVLAQGLTSNGNQRPKLSKGRKAKSLSSTYQLPWLPPEEGGVCAARCTHRTTFGSWFFPSAMDSRD